MGNVDASASEKAVMGLHPLRLRDFEVLYQLHARDAMSLAYLLTGDRDLAEDIMQEAFVRVGRRFADIRREDVFPAYLRRVVVNLVRSHARRSLVARRNLHRVVADPTTEATSSLEKGELWQALGLLPHRQRSALLLRFAEDLSEREVADLLGTSEKAVRSLVSRGREALREQLGGTDPWDR